MGDCRIRTAQCLGRIGDFDRGKWAEQGGKIRGGCETVANGGEVARAAAPDGETGERAGEVGRRGKTLAQLVDHNAHDKLVAWGWAPGADREILSRDEAIEIFDLSDVNKAPAVFDPEKLLWLNGQYMSRLSIEELLPHLERFLTIEIDSRERLAVVVGVNKTRARTLRDLADLLVPYFSDDESITYEQDAIDKHLRGADLLQRMTDLRATFASLDDFDVTTTEKALRTLGESKATGAGKYIHSLRVALLGKLNSPPIFDVIAAS